MTGKDGVGALNVRCRETDKRERENVTEYVSLLERCGGRRGKRGRGRERVKMRVCTRA